MNLAIKSLFCISLFLNINFVSAEVVSEHIDPDELAAVCGQKSCATVFSKMKKFAKNGSPHAQAVISLMYKGGFGTEVNEELSVRYMRRAAKAGLAYAQYNLGLLYRNGYLVEKDQEEGDSWLLRSAKAGYDKSIELLLSENKLTSEESLEYKKTVEMPSIEKGEELLTITRDKYSLSDLMDLLNSLGYGNDKQTGSRIKGRGCGKNISQCYVWKMNSPVGRSQFATMISKINGFQTGVEMNSRSK